MYIGSFIKCLFTPRKLPSALYFLANQALVFCIFYFLGVGAEVENPLNWGIFGIIANLVAMIAMLSPLGEAIVRYREKATAVSRSQFPYVCQLFENICTTATTVNKRLPQDIRLYVMPGNEINAAATGHHTVIVTQALLEAVESRRIPPQHFKAVIAHELGHVSHSDTSLTLGIVVSDGLIQLVLCGYLFVIRTISRLLALFSFTLATVFYVAFGRTVTFLFDCWTKLGIILTNATSRKDEFAADNFAGKCGYAAELCDFLFAIDSRRDRGNFLSVLAETHPATVDRVAALQKDFRL